jgi:hypothetical protein
MRNLTRLLLYLLLCLGAVRMGLYLVFTANVFPLPLEVHDLEAKFVLQAYRVERGLSLYPAWWDYPYVCNWFGPVNSLLVGLLGRWLAGGIPGLFLIGRAVSFGSGLLTALVLAVAINRRYRQGAGLAAGVLSLGTAPMFGFTVTVRPDALAELLGLSGFLLTAIRSRGGRWAGVALLILAVLTKQTAIVFLLAAGLAPALAGERRWGMVILGAAGAGLIVIILAVNLLFEPHFAFSLVAEGTLPWSYATWRLVLERIVRSSPELLLFPAVGLWLWLGGRDRSRPLEIHPTVLVLSLLAAALGLSAKLGADINYYLNLRIAEALAVGALWHAVHSDIRANTTIPHGSFRIQSAALATTLLLAIVALLPSVRLAMVNADLSNTEAAFYEGPNGQRLLRTYRDAIALARNPRVRLLTDCGLIDLYQGERAAFGDPWLFHTLVESGLLRPTTMAERIRLRYYDVFISTHDLDSPDYAHHDFRLPEGLFECVRTNYALAEHPQGLLIYRRRERPMDHGEKGTAANAAANRSDHGAGPGRGRSRLTSQRRD